MLPKLRGNPEGGHVTQSLTPTSIVQALKASEPLQDELTRLPNARAFRLLANQQLRSASRKNSGLVLFAIGIRGLEAIRNVDDEREPDWVLVELAELLRQTFRESDVIARYDQATFVVLATDSVEQDAPAITERLSYGLDAVQTRRQRSYELRIDIGAAEYHRGATVGQLLDQAIRRAHAG